MIGSFVLSPLLVLGAVKVPAACTTELLKLEQPLVGLQLGGRSVEELEAQYEEPVGRLFEAAQIAHRTLFDDWNLPLESEIRNSIALRLHQKPEYRDVLLSLGPTMSYWRLLQVMEGAKIPDPEKAALLGISLNAVKQILDLERARKWIVWRGHRWTRAELVVFFYLRGFSAEKISEQINYLANAQIVSVDDVTRRIDRMGLKQPKVTWRGTWDEGYLIRAGNFVWPNLGIYILHSMNSNPQRLSSFLSQTGVDQFNFEAQMKQNGFFWHPKANLWTFADHSRSSDWEKQSQQIVWLDETLDHFARLGVDINSNYLAKAFGWRGLSRSSLNEHFGGGDQFWLALIKRSYVRGLRMNFLKLRMREGRQEHRDLKKQMMVDRILDLMESGTPWAEIRKMKSNVLGFEIRAFLGVENYAEGNKARGAAIHSGPREAFVHLYQEGLRRGLSLPILKFYAEEYFTEDFRKIAQAQILETMLVESLKSGALLSMDDLASILGLPKQQILGYEENGSGLHPNHFFASTAIFYDRLEIALKEDPRLSAGERRSFLHSLSGRRNISSAQRLP